MFAGAEGGQAGMKLEQGRAGWKWIGSRIGDAVYGRGFHQILTLKLELEALHESSWTSAKIFFYPSSLIGQDEVLHRIRKQIFLYCKEISSLSSFCTGDNMGSEATLCMYCIGSGCPTVSSCDATGLIFAFGSVQLALPGSHDVINSQPPHLFCASLFTFSKFTLVTSLFLFAIERAL